MVCQILYKLWQCRSEYGMKQCAVGGWCCAGSLGVQCWEQQGRLPGGGDWGPLTGTAGRADVSSWWKGTRPAQGKENITNSCGKQAVWGGRMARLGTHRGWE